jgi:hypothetical protein
MAQAIAALYERDLEALGSAARARVLKQFTWQRAFHGQLATYISLVGAQRLPLAGSEEILPLRSPSS